MFRWFKVQHGRFVKSGVVDADNDEQALCKVHQEPDCPTCEVWQGQRMVGVVDHPKKA